MLNNNRIDKEQNELYLIPVPLSDEARIADVMPQYVVDITKELDCFFVENVRSARRFLKTIDPDMNIDTKTFHVLDEHTTFRDIPILRSALLKSHKAGVISEAGCPGVADPGSRIVEVARSEGYRIIPLVGPSSIIMGLMSSGFNGQNFCFSGYLPYDSGERKRKLNAMVREISTSNQTQIFIETPYRNNKLLAELTHLLPPHMRLCVACDLTSPNEVIVVKSIKEWQNAPMDFSKRPAIFLLSK